VESSRRSKKNTGDQQTFQGGRGGVYAEGGGKSTLNFNSDPARYTSGAIRETMKRNECFILGRLAIARHQRTYSTGKKAVTTKVRHKPPVFVKRVKLEG